MLILMSAFQSLRVMNGRFVDPFRVARLQDSNTALTFPIPSANIRWQGNASVRDSFRAAIDAQLYSKSKRIDPNDPSTSLRTTLFHLASRRRGQAPAPATRPAFSCTPAQICGREHIELRDQPAVQHCPTCGSEVYPADCLRIWELVAENQSDVAALTRLMSARRAPSHHALHPLPGRNLSSRPAQNRLLPRRSPRHLRQRRLDACLHHALSRRNQPQA